MANNYSNCEKKYDRQLAAAYAVYMMAGSAFKKCICRNPLEEGHLCLHYREMPDLWRKATSVCITGRCRNGSSWRRKTQCWPGWRLWERDAWRQ